MRRVAGFLATALVLAGAHAMAQGPVTSQPSVAPAEAAPPGTRETALPASSAPLPEELGTLPEPAAGNTSQGTVTDAKAMELAGVRATSPVRFTSEPSGARVLVNNQAACQTPCIIQLPAGTYTFRYELKSFKDVEVEHSVVASEELGLFAKLGDKVPYEIAFPLLGVGAIFIAGGIYGMVKGYSNQDMTPENRVWNRNLGWATLAIGAPMVTVSIWLFFSGTENKVIISMSPSPLSLEPSPRQGGEPTP